MDRELLYLLVFIVTALPLLVSGFLRRPAGVSASKRSLAARFADGPLGTFLLRLRRGSVEPLRVELVKAGRHEDSVAEVFVDEEQKDIVYRNMAVNSTAVIGYDSEGKEMLLGNPTEGALLLYLRSMGIDYAAMRSATKIGLSLPSGRKEFLPLCFATKVPSITCPD